MKQLILGVFLTLLLSLPISYAAHVYFEDGRVCQGCKVEYTPNGFIKSVKDKKQNEWLLEKPQKVVVYKHPYWSNYWRQVGENQRLMMQSGAYNFRSYSAPAQTQSIRTNCNTYGNSTNCYSY